MTTKKANKRRVMHYLFTGRLANSLRIIFTNRVGLSYIPKVIAILLVNLLTVPLRLIEKLIYDKQINSTRIEKPPVFILGHWRSGTTYLVNIMSRDKQFGFFNIVSMMVPEMFLAFGRLYTALAERIMPKKRPMDNIELRIDMPQEEDYAVANWVPYSVTHMMAFPESYRKFKRYGLLRDLTGEQFGSWRKTYEYLVKKVTLQYGGRRLLLKSPINTCRIKYLLEIYPGAKFIHICRDPAEVFMSTHRLYDNLFPLYSLQGYKVPSEMVDSFLFDLYSAMYHSYFEEKGLIPEGDLVEIRYEDFIKDPVASLEGIYEELGLTGFEDARETMQEYVATQDRYRAESYEIEPELLARIRRETDFVAKEWGY